MRSAHPVRSSARPEDDHVLAPNQRPGYDRPIEARSFSKRGAALVALSVLALAACNRHGDAPDDANATAQASAAPTTSVAVAPPPPAPTATASASTSAIASAAPKAEAPRVYTRSKDDCDALAVYAGGKESGAVCLDDLEKEGLTAIDLSDTWTPRVFTPNPNTGDAPPYRDKYLRLAGQRDTDLGLYGIAPTLSLLVERLSDEKRQACQAAVDRAPLAELSEAMKAEADPKKAAALAGKKESKDAVLAAQAQLLCDKLILKSQARGNIGQSTSIGLEIFRRRHMIVATYGLDPDTVAALTLPGEELDFRAVLRGLRERVAEAAGLIEDGSASNTTGTVAGRKLDLSAFTARGNPAPLPNGAPDLIDPAADAAAKALGWTSPEAVKAFMDERGPGGLAKLKVAVKLPPAPSYASKAMDLRVEIDRGDVFYDTPYQTTLARKRLGNVRPPTFVIYARENGKDRALVRWQTTIGGWQKERVDQGEVVLRYKESDVGERFWRHVIAAPAWLPPESTPESELVREGGDGSPALKKDLIEPGFLNAYGLVMMVHDEKVEDGDDVSWEDHGIRTHGSVNYKSILRGESHGCHRLYNHLALRVSGYLLAHRRYVRRGKLHSKFHRTLEFKDQKIELEVPIRGYLYELDPPVQVRVLEGRIAGEAQSPMAGQIRLKTDPEKSEKSG